MTTERSIQKDLVDLLNHQKGICLSLVFPTEPAGAGRAAGNLHIDKMIEKARLALLRSFDHEKLKPVFRNLDLLYDDIDFLHMANGLGIYVSEDFKLLVRFPFPVREKILVGEQFETRELLYYRSYDKPWLLVCLTEQDVRLYNGHWNKLSEVRDGSFPHKKESFYEYSKPSRSSSFGGHAHVKMFEKDRSEGETLKLGHFYKKADKLLARYLGNEMPVVLAGPRKDLSLFLKNSRHKATITGTIPGNYQYAFPELADLAWDMVYKKQGELAKKMVAELREKLGEGRGVTGLKQVWNAVNEGKGLTLLVEKDYQVPGFVVKESGKLYLRAPRKEYRFIPDVVDELSKRMIHKKEKLFFVENGSLEEFGHLGLVTRY